MLLDNGKVLRPKLGGGDPIDAFVAELSEVVRAVRTNTPSPLLAGELARDAVAPLPEADRIGAARQGREGVVTRAPAGQVQIPQEAFISVLAADRKQRASPASIFLGDGRIRVAGHGRAGYLNEYGPHD